MTQVVLASSDDRLSQKKRSCDDEGDSPAPYRRPKTNVASKSDPNSRRFACPFAIAAPKNFEKINCFHRGWPDIPRLKEHLYRRHYQRHIACERCLKSFQQEKDLLAHRRQPVPCEIVEMKARDPIIHGMDEKTMNVLKSRKRSSVADDEEKWYEIWDALFTDRQRPDSPYAPNRVVQSADTLFARYLEQYLKTKLPSLLKQSLEMTSVTKIELEAVGETISKCLDSAIQQFPDQGEASPAASTILEPARPPVPQYFKSAKFAPENGDLNLFSDQKLTCSPTYLPADEISTHFCGLSCAGTTQSTDISSTPYSVISDVSTAESNCISSPWPDGMPDIGLEANLDSWDSSNFGLVSTNLGFPYHIYPPSMDFNFSPTDHPTTFTGVIDNDKCE